MMMQVIGSIVIVLAVATIAAVLFHYSWFEKHFSFLCYWGRPGGLIGWPASKEGVLLGATMGFFIGLIGVFQGSHPIVTEYLGYCFAGLVVLAIPLGIRDFRIHRRDSRTAEK